MSESAAFQPDWSSYYQAVAAHPPRHTLVRALALRDARERAPLEPPLAIDLGCGGGRDTRLLLERGWRVLAIDAEAEAIARLNDSLASQPELRDRLSVQVCPFAEIDWPPSARLVNASFSLPFCPPDGFADLWRSIAGVLADGGWFCGQFFGDRDEWARHPNITSQRREDVLALLADFAIAELNEEEYDGTTATNTAKHWHIFHAIAHRSKC